MIITISGLPGSGKTTVAKKLSEILGLKYYSIGTIMRDLAKDLGISLSELSKIAEEDRKIDMKIDEKQKMIAKEDNIIVDSRLGFYFIPNSIKIFLTVDPKIASKRIFENKREDEKYRSIKEAYNKIKLRMESEKKRYLTYYNIDYTDPKHYDLIIDTSDLNVDEIIEIILKFLKEFI